MPERTWEILEGACKSCKKCRLWEMRTNVVIGKGNKNADIMFVGEAPGQQEDLQGIPFVGASGKLLDEMVKSVGLNMKDIYVANIVKCRPPGNRDPHEDEQSSCMNYLRYQFLLIKPKIVVCLGRIAATAIIEPTFKITKQRGQWIEKKGIWFTATYHPSAILRYEENKQPSLEDLKAVKNKLDELKF